MARKNGLTRRQRSLINKQEWAEKRRLQEEQWARIREAKLYPPPTEWRNGQK